MTKMLNVDVSKLSQEDLDLLIEFLKSKGLQVTISDTLESILENLSEEDLELLKKIIEEKGMLPKTHKDEDNPIIDDISKEEEQREELKDILNERNKIIDGEYEGNAKDQKKYLGDEIERFEIFKDEVDNNLLSPDDESLKNQLDETLDQDHNHIEGYMENLEENKQVQTKEKDINHILSKFTPVGEKPMVKESIFSDTKIDKNTNDYDMSNEVQEPEAYKDYKENGFVPKMSSPFDIPS